MTKTGSPREYAKHRGVSDVAVSKALKTGRIAPYAKNGKRLILDFDQCDRMWETNKDPSNRGWDKPKKIEVTEVLTPGRTRQQPVEDDEDDPKKMNFNQARTLRERYQAELARLEFEEKSAILVRAEDVKAEAFKRARVARDTLLNFPDRLAPMLAGRTEIHEVRKILLEEIHRVCQSLAV